MEGNDEGIGSWNYGYGYGLIPPNLDPPLPVPPLPPIMPHHPDLINNVIFQQQQQQQQQFNNMIFGLPPPPPPPLPNNPTNKTSFNFLGILGVEEYNSRISEGILSSQGSSSRVGVQVVGKRFEEERVLAVMKVIDGLVPKVIR